MVGRTTWTWRSPRSLQLAWPLHRPPRSLILTLPSWQPSGFNSHGRHDGLYGHCDCHIVIVTSTVDTMSSKIAGTAMAFLESFMASATPMAIMTARSQHVRIKCMADKVALKMVRSFVLKCLVDTAWIKIKLKFCNIGQQLTRRGLTPKYVGWLKMKKRIGLG